MAQSGFKLNPRLQAEWKAAIGELASIANKDDPESVQKLVMLSARRFVKNVAAITPPSHGSVQGQAAKQHGEGKILGDLQKIAQPVTVAGTSRQAREVLADAGRLAALHELARRNGTVPSRRGREKVLVSNTTFNQVLTMLQKKVGTLAAGLNSAANRLGVSLPAWVRRHGSKYGSIQVTARRHGLRVRIIQDVPFAEDVANYTRKWDFALKKEIAALIAQAKAIFAKKAARAKARLSRR